jgi:hypothetical protein
VAQVIDRKMLNSGARLDLKTVLLGVVLLIVTFGLGFGAHQRWSKGATDAARIQPSEPTSRSSSVSNPLARLSRHSTNPTSRRIDLNVGGYRYATTLATLLKYNDSTLFTLFAGSPNLLLQPDNSYFINRDGASFRHILNYLRDGDQMAFSGFYTVVPGGSVNLGAPTPKYQKTPLNQAVMAEAKYYKLSGLISLLDNPILKCRLCKQLIRLADATPYSIGPRTWHTQGMSVFESNAYTVRSQCMVAQAVLALTSRANGGTHLGPPPLALHDFTDSFT